MPANFENFWKRKEAEKTEEINAMNIKVDCRHEYDKQFDKFFA